MLATDDELTEESTGTDPRRLYGRWYYECSFGLPYHHTEHWKSFFGGVADNVIRQLAPRTVLDAGCAKGFLVAAFRARGIEAVGVDLSEDAIADAPEPAQGHLRVGSLTEPIDGRYDLVTCIEVVEHLDPADTFAAISNICSATDAVLLSSSPKDLAEPTHVNVLPPERWSQMMAAQGFYRDFHHDAAYLTPWAALYRRGEPTIGDVVVDYDRAWYQLREETIEQRRAILTAEEKIQDLLAGNGTVDKLENELNDTRKEVLRLRDALIGREAELGSALGHVAELRAVLAKTQDVQNRLDQVMASRSWRLMWSVGKPVRALRSALRS